MKKALIIIDVQNDYFDNGAYPQFESEMILPRIEKAIVHAKANNWLIIFVKHEAPTGGFLQKGTTGSEIHAELLAESLQNPIVIKTHADSFLNTNLQEILSQNQVTEIYLSGIMTQNCITHTALSPMATAYDMIILANLCTAPTSKVHQIALKALSDRVKVVENIA